MARTLSDSKVWFKYEFWYGVAMECISPLDSLACFLNTAEIVFPLFLISWLVGMMLAAFFVGADRRALTWVAVITFPLGFVSVVAVAVAFAAAGTGGLYELLVGPAVVFGECVGLARAAALRAAARSEG